MPSRTPSVFTVRQCAFKAVPSFVVAALAIGLAGPAVAAEPDTTAPKSVSGMKVSTSTSSVKLDWTSNSEKDLAGYYVYRAGAGGTFARLTTSLRSSSDFSDSTATAGVLSTYRVTAVDKSGNESAPLEITAVRKDSTTPAVPATVTATRTEAGVVLDWADNTETDFAGYVVTRATSAGGTYTKLTVAPVTASTYTDTTATGGVGYYYKITASDLSGNTSATAAVSSLVPDTAAPKAVSGLKATTSTSSVKLDWSSNSEKDLAGYLVSRVAADGTVTRLTATPRSSSDFTDATAPVGVESTYRVAAVDKSGNESAVVEVKATRKDATAPAAPATVTATRTEVGVVLDWADNTEADLAGYVVTRATSAGGTYTKLTATPVTASTYTDTTATAGVAYYYKVAALDVSANTSSAVSVSSLVPDTTAPKVVAGLVTSASTSRVKLDWTSNTDSDLAGYRVYRLNATGGFDLLTTALVTSSEYNDTTAPAGVVSTYRVSAVDKTGNESEPVEVSATRVDTTAPATPTSLSAVSGAEGIALDWADNTEADLAGYVIIRAATSGGTYTKLTATPVTASTYTDTTTTAGVTYYYKVAALDLGGNTSATRAVTATVPDTTAPQAPTALTASTGTTGVSLTWTASTDDDVVGYHVYRAATPEGDFERLTTTPVTAASYLDATSSLASASSYRITALDAAGNESAPSAVTSSVPADTTAPAQPAALSAVIGGDGVALTWMANSESDVAGYLVYRSTTADGTYTKLTATPVTAAAYTDTTANTAVANYYRVTALDSSGNESPTAATSALPVVVKNPVAGADVTVAADGSGDYSTVAAALAAAPANASASAASYIIGIRPGTYRELLTVDKPNVTLQGATDNAADVVITYDNAAGTAKPYGSGTYGTSGSATVLIKANGVTTKNLTIENSYVETGTGSEQAVALKTTGDKLVFDNVRLLGDQDTLYADSPRAGALARSYYVNSYVEGDVDFIFGRGTVVFDRSTIKAATRGSTSNNGYVTAASTDKSLAYGYLITDSQITSDAPANTFSLGRPWQPSGDVNAIAQVVIRDTELPAAIKSTPWSDFGTSAWKNARFFEYRNTGAGATVTADRPQLSDLDAAKYTKFTYLAGADGWNPTGQTPPPPPADTTAPVAVTGLGAEAGDSSVTLTWTATTDDDLAGYDVYRSTGDTVNLTAANRIATAVTGTSYTDRTAANGTTYRYVVVALDRTGNASPASAAVPGAPVGVPLPAHDILVAADGTGQFTTVQAAIAAAPAGTAAEPTVIAVKPGTYREMITVSKSYVQLIGTTGKATDVVLTYDNAGGTTNPATGAIYGTGNSQSVLISGSNVTVRDLTISNAFDEAAVVLAGGEQAVALKTTGDRLVFDNVRLLGNQDTLLVDSPNAYTVARSYFVNSYIEGDVDFIFGRGTAVFQRSTIHALTRGSSSNNGYITAASTSDQNPYGFLITDSTITSNAPARTFSLGRPWRGWTDATQVRNGVTYNSRGQVTIRNTALPAAVRATQPWADMSPNLWTDGRFSEYQNTGAGAGVNANRPQASDEQAAAATPQAYLAGSDGWNPIR